MLLAMISRAAPFSQHYYLDDQTMRQEGIWWCDACDKPAALERDGRECSVCRNAVSCGEYCDLSALTCSGCGVRVQLGVS